MASADTSPLPFDLAGSSNTLRTASTRCNTSSSYSSDAYAPLPPGLWFLNLHGNCSRCHHHHNSARFKVNIPRNPNVTTHVKCQGCNEKWLAIGGRNASQLSLLSINTIRPNPAAAEVRYSLVNMVRATTALATLSPVLARIAEPSSLGPSLQHNHSLDEGRISDSAPPTLEPETVPQPGDLSASQSQGPSSLLMPATVRPTTSQKYGFMTGRRMSHLKESVGMRFPAFHRANLRSKFGSLTKPRISAKQLGKQPLSDPVRGEHSTGDSQAPDATVQREHSDAEVLEGPSRRSTGLKNHTLGSSSVAAATFLAALSTDPSDLGNMTKKQKADWVRAKYTEFMNSSIVSTNDGSTTADSAEAAAMAAESATAISSDERPRISFDLAGVGGRQSPSDRSYSFRASMITVSDRISEADTIVDDDATMVASDLRFSFEQFRSERYGSTRPRSLNAYTLQLSRLRRAELRRSGNSAVTVEAIPSTSRPGSSASDHSSHGSTIRRSMPGEIDSTGSRSSLDIRS